MANRSKILFSFKYFELYYYYYFNNFCIVHKSIVVWTGLVVNLSFYT